MAENITNNGAAQGVVEFRFEDQSIIMPELVQHTVLWSEAFNSGASATLEFATLNSDWVNSVLNLVSLKAEPAIQIRLGLGTPGNFIWLPWQSHSMVRFAALPSSIGETDGYKISMRTVDPIFTMGIAKKVTAHSGKISDIISAIVQQNGLASSVVEPTNGVTMFIQSFESDTTFISHRLVDLAVNNSGRGNYAFYIKDNAFHFHTWDYQAELKFVDFFNKSSATTITAVDQSQLQLYRGAAGVSVTLVDPLTGEIAFVSSDPSRTLALGELAPKLTEIEGADLNLLLHAGPNLAVEAQSLAQTKYEAAHSGLFKLILNTEKTLSLRLNDFLFVNLNSNPSRVSPWTGYYCVTKVDHVFESGDLKSSFVLSRGEYSGISNSRNVDNSLTSEFAAKGKKINAKEIDATKLTRGPETATVRAVRDPATGEEV